MQLNNLDQVEQTAKKVNFSIFELPSETVFSKIFAKSYHIAPEGKTNEIKVDQVREILQLVNSSQSSDLNIIFEQADRIKTEAANMLLKTLEEPNSHIHYIFLTNNANGILPTLQSRANKYYVRGNKKISDAPSADIKIFSLAKEYISATPNTLPSVVEKIMKLNKDDTRKTAQEVVSCSIELTYKSYLLKGNKSFLVKLEQLLKTQAALEQNGHIKLQMIANML